MSDTLQDTDNLEIEEESALEQGPLTTGIELRRIVTQSSDTTIKDLRDRYKDGDLILQPDFQRYFVWDRAKSSRLIESVVLDVPLPIIYLTEEADGREEVIDGQQRLTSFFRFLDNELALFNLQIRTDLNGKRYRDLERDLQNKVKRATLRTVTIKKESSEDLKFEIFQRLNTASVALNDQELRNCVYAGSYNRLLRELASDPDFMFLLGISHPETRMRDVELALRFAAFYHATYIHYRPPVKRFLNSDMNRFRQISTEDAGTLLHAFKTAAQTVRSLLGSNAFRRYYQGTEANPNGYWEPKRFNTSLYDILMWGFSLYERNQVFPHLDSIREALIVLMTEDQEFIDSIELSTSSVRAVTVRFKKWHTTLQNIVGSPHSEPRCFSRALKEALFQSEPICALCGQSIQDVDDAAVDHIVQYWAGGRTIPENARLTHRYCNAIRPRRD